MKYKTAVIMVIPVLLIAAAALFYWYIRSQAQPIVIDDPIPESSQPIEQTEPIENVVIPEITVPMPEQTQPTQDNVLTPEKVLPDNPAPEVKPDGDEKQPTPPPDDTPTGGEKKDGKIFLPGFGWIDDHGGGTDAEFWDVNPNGNIVGY